MKRKKTKPDPNEPWTEFAECNYMADASGQEYDIPPGIRIFKNNLFTVHVEETEPLEPFGSVTWLSIKRNDRAPIPSHWRTLQLIKNALCGPEREAVEIYPAESRLVDTSNQFHIWVFPEGYRIPFGYAKRLVIDETVSQHPLGKNARQQPWPKHQRPTDVLTGPEIARREREDPKFGLQPVVHRRKLP